MCDQILWQVLSGSPRRVFFVIRGLGLCSLIVIASSPKVGVAISNLWVDEIASVASVLRSGAAAKDESLHRNDNGR